MEGIKVQFTAHGTATQSKAAALETLNWPDKTDGYTHCLFVVAEAKALETSYADASKALEEASSRATEAEKRAAELTEGRKHRVVALRKAEAARKKEQAVIQEKEEFIREQSEAVHKS